MKLVGLCLVVILEGILAGPILNQDFWNAPSKYYRSSPVELDPEPFSYVITDEDPKTDAEIQSYISRHGLKHGDIVNFDEYRESEAYIVCYDDILKKYKFLENEDDSEAGYLSIPEEVLAHVTDFKTKYAEVLDFIKDQSEVINFHVSPTDNFVVDKLGKVPIGYKFDVYFEGKDYIETFAVKKTGTKWYDFDYDTVTLNDVIAYFKAMREVQKKFTIKVSLQGDEMKQYKTKYGGPGKYDWLMAKPKLPIGWRVERGQSSMGLDKMQWDWTFSGPISSIKKAKKKAKTFLEGFTYNFV